MITSTRTALLRRIKESTLVRNVAAAATASASLNPADVQLRRSSRSTTRRHDPFELRRLFSHDEQIRNDLAYCMSFSTNAATASDYDESESSDLSNTNFVKLLTNDTMKEQLEISKNQLKKYNTTTTKSGGITAHNTRIDDEPLPRTYDDALRQNKKRAIVITESKAPFRVVDVNSAWEQLCGYSHIESKGKTLGELLSGPRTNTGTATAMINQLLRGGGEEEECTTVGATLINYKKNGQPFRNRLRCGPLVSSSSSSSGNSSNTTTKPTVTHFVGVLQEVPPPDHR